MWPHSKTCQSESSSLFIMAPVGYSWDEYISQFSLVYSMSKTILISQAMPPSLTIISQVKYKLHGPTSVYVQVWGMENEHSDSHCTCCLPCLCTSLDLIINLPVCWVSEPCLVTVWFAKSQSKINDSYSKYFLIIHICSFRIFSSMFICLQLWDSY